MLSSLKKANELMMKELAEYHRREAEMQRKEAMLEGVIKENEELKAELEALRNKANEEELLKQ